MKPLPRSDQSLVIRTDFSDEAAWLAVGLAIREPVDGFYAYVDLVDDTAFDGATVDQLVTLGSDAHRSFLIVADGETMRGRERTLLIVDVFTEPGRTFRAVPSGIQSIENNLSIANMDFAEFADSVDADGVFRGIPG
jgi:hypothetical protein